MKKMDNYVEVYIDSVDLGSDYIEASLLRVAHKMNGIHFIFSRNVCSE
ncbi:hypothetical protein MHK_001076 [Candidatus Magnetomorum sp. HK-1]|nr:hypothetical protein MHK_001076 [Candidatus Magnetomorum sp. HK-1]